MDDSYGIFTTDGQIVAGDLYDDSVVRLAEKLDESMASLYISTKNGQFLLGAAVNVQKKGRRPDTFIYLEKLLWYSKIPPRIDLAYIHDFYRRIETHLLEIDYKIRDLASDARFFGERQKQTITRLSSADVSQYCTGRILLSKPVVCISADLLKSVDFVLSVTEKIAPYLHTGFTIVVSKRTFKDADLLVTESYPDGYNIELDSETVTDPFEYYYKSAGLLSQRQDVTATLSGAKTRERLTLGLISDLKSYERQKGDKAGDTDSFIKSENIGVFADFAYERESSPKTRSINGSKRPSEEEYTKWEVTGPERDRLKKDYEEHMEKKRRGRLKIIVLVLFAVVFFAVASILFVIPKMQINESTIIQTQTETPYETLVPTPPSKTAVIERLNATFGNTPSGLSGASGIYRITVREPEIVHINLSENYTPDYSYYLMKFNETGYTWDYVSGTSEYSEKGADVDILTSGIYRIFAGKQPAENMSWDI
ncbi:hypothetical protein F1737_10380 [Methanoplanus sp. FWC-SCC4]|uniref:Uncharacterized protein n=1 Tax=Methanochimaera problematica TaxID=2609417 RepID=A0AA97I374_9EURY|nr:hypothetical protein [Methanoplanus sp. FWC-SCC4]WOF17055.1 hypothetical protein F1737_10380 [Methanoplanus sp. FWC-SCC4]